MLYEYLLLRQPIFQAEMSFEQKLKDACNGREVPGVVLAASGPGKFRYEKAFGMHSVKERRRGKALEVDATFSLASCTKLMTTVAALQCVERGLLSLDGDVTKVLPELKDIDILLDFDHMMQQPILMKSKNIITLRHLLTHTSGISHPAWNYCLYEYLTSQARPVALSCTGRIANSCLYPLVFEPGTSWEYGAGLEWAGKMVERVHGNISLQEYMEINIWAPLNMTSATFRLGERPDLEDKLPAMTYREGLNHPIYATTMDPNGRLVSAPPTPEEDRVTPVEELSDDFIDDPGDDDFGGGGAYCSAPDFARFLNSLCTNDAVLLKPCTVDEMFTPQLTAPARSRMQKFFAIKDINNIFSAGLPLTNPPLALNFGLGGLLVMENVPPEADLLALAGVGSGSGRRRGKGSMCWSGLPNLYWWMDREACVSGFYASQLLPQGDPRSLEMMAQFEEWVYEKVTSGARANRTGLGKGMGRGAS